MWAALFGLAASAKTCGEAIEGLSAPKVGEGHDFFTGIALQMLARAERLQSANAPLGDEDCPVKLAERSFCEDCPESRITVLWSIPGSGNTFTRTLVEASTLIHTGSKYYDRAIARKLPGELENVTEADSCSRLSVIKMHGNTDACCGQFLNSLCDFEAKHAIFLIRHPISASWAEFQRKLSSSHTAALVTASSASMQQAPWFPDWEKRSQKLLKYWGKTVHEDGQYGMYAKVYGDASYTILRFEDLVDPSTREVCPHLIADSRSLTRHSLG